MIREQHIYVLLTHPRVREGAVRALYGAPHAPYTYICWSSARSARIIARACVRMQHIYVLPCSLMLVHACTSRGRGPIPGAIAALLMLGNTSCRVSILLVILSFRAGK